MKLRRRAGQVLGSILLALCLWLIVLSVVPLCPEEVPARYESTQRVPSMNPITFPSDGIDVNTANVEMLDTLPGIGPVLAQAIIDAREKEPFHYPEDLLDVYGIGEKTLDKLYNLIRITEVTP